MRTLTLLIILTLICQTEVSSQSCLPGGITFSTQAEIDNFQEDHPNCTEIEGIVVINGNNITNLIGLNVITSLHDNLQINNNPNLVNLIGLNNITSISGNVKLIYNNSLASLTGLENIYSIGGKLEIQTHSGLINLVGLNSLAFIGGSLTISDNTALTSIIGLYSLDSIGGNLTILTNELLNNLSGLDNLRSIGGGGLTIETNSGLSSLNGIENIEAETIGDLHIIDNSSLSICEIKSICDFLAIPNCYAVIENNAPNCNSQEEVEYACTVMISNTNMNFVFTYPNPARNILYISNINGSIIKEITIYDQFGRSVLSKTKIIDNIDISTLAQGIYIIELVTNKSKFRQKLIKE